MIVLADMEGHDQTTRICRLIWAFAVCTDVPEDGTFSHGAGHIMFAVVFFYV